MDVSIFLAKAFSIYLILISLAIIFQRKFFQDAIKELLTHEPAMLLAAILALILGILLVISHNLFVADWRIVITILAWLTLIKGFVGLFFPMQSSSWRIKIIEKPHTLYITAIVCLFLGLFLGYHGFLL